MEKKAKEEIWTFEETNDLINGTAKACVQKNPWGDGAQSQGMEGDCECTGSHHTAEKYHNKWAYLHSVLAKPALMHLLHQSQ